MAACQLRGCDLGTAAVVVLDVAVLVVGEAGRAVVVAFEFEGGAARIIVKIAVTTSFSGCKMCTSPGTLAASTLWSEVPSGGSKGSFKPSPSEKNHHLI